MSPRPPGAAGPGSRRGLAVVAGAVAVALVVFLNVPGNPVGELRDHRVAGMLLAHAGMLVLAYGLWPTLPAALARVATLPGRRLAAGLAAVVAGVAAAMVVVAVVWPETGHQLLTREWGVVEPLQFVLYLLTARLCFALAQRSAPRTSWRRLSMLGGWLGRLFALEEVDYLGVLSSLMRLAGVERSRIAGSYVGALHDALNVATQTGLGWLALAALALAAVAIGLWVGGGRIAALRAMLSWRLVPALVGVGFMAVAQLEDVHDVEISGLETSRLLQDLLEEPCELLAILCVTLTLVLELARADRAACVTARAPGLTG